jgi:cellulose synthase/poly-beta-1,6-N-acetylglucosamine synthase-like glycosyltransferase
MEFSLALFIALLVLAAIYAIALLLVLHGWSRLTHDQALETDLISNESAFLSVVVAARNEAKNIVPLIESLVCQDLDPRQFEIIIADDHSDDDTAELVQELTDKYSNLRLVRCGGSGGSGKKHALSRAIDVVKGDIIVITDADCRLHPAWLRQHLSVYLKKEVQMVSGPVAFVEKKGFLASFQEMEMSSLMALTGAMFAFKNPFLSNGANISFRKSAFIKIGGFEGYEKYPSGDDVFLLHQLKKEFPFGLYFINNPEAVVRTAPVQRLHQFYYQRVRWASKWKAFFQLMKQKHIVT